MNLSDLILKFDFKRVQRKSAVFDQKKLNWISSQHLKNQDPEKVLTAIRVIEPDWGKNRNKNFLFCLALSATNEQASFNNSSV